MILLHSMQGTHLLSYPPKIYSLHFSVYDIVSLTFGFPGEIPDLISRQNKKYWHLL